MLIIFGRFLHRVHHLQEFVEVDLTISVDVSVLDHLVPYGLIHPVGLFPDHVL